MIRRPPRSTLFPTRRSSDLQVHRVEHLPSHQALVQGARELDQAVGQGRLPMVDMGHNTEVADVILAHVREKYRRYLYWTEALSLPPITGWCDPASHGGAVRDSG